MKEFTIKNAKTVAQYKILHWINENFYMSMLKVKMLDAYSVLIEDMVGDSMKLTFDEKSNEIIDAKTKEVLGRYGKSSEERDYIDAKTKEILNRYGEISKK